VYSRHQTALRSLGGSMHVCVLLLLARGQHCYAGRIICWTARL